jgi:hypothetical protein
MIFKKTSKYFATGLMIAGLWVIAAPFVFMYYMEYLSNEALQAAYANRLINDKIKIGISRSEVKKLLLKVKYYEYDWWCCGKEKEGYCIIILPGTLRTDNPALLFDSNDKLCQMYPHFGD